MAATILSSSIPPTRAKTTASRVTMVATRLIRVPPQVGSASNVKLGNFTKVLISPPALDVKGDIRRLLSRLNERTVLETIRTGAPISRAEISRRAEISKPTVSLALQSLLEAGLVREAGVAPSGPSYGAVYFESVPEAALVLCLDLGARFLRGAIC